MNKTSAYYLVCSIICALIMIFLPAGCNGKGDGGKETRVIKRDTTLTLAAYLGYQLKSKHWGPARKIQWDSLVIKYGKDSVPETGWEKYTYYEAEIPMLVDSFLHKQFGDPMLDSTGKPNVVRKLVAIPAKYVRDSITNLDSALKYLDQYLVKDSLPQIKP